MKNKRKLKIAVCFFGHLRTYKKCSSFLCKNLLNKHDCDLFMHTWTTLDHNTKSWHKMAMMKGVTSQKEILRAYGEFKGLEIEQQKPQNFGMVRIKTDYNSKESQMSIFGIGAMFHSLRESNRLREEYAAKNKVNYDFVLCVRPDIWLKKPLDIEKTIEILSKQDISRGLFTFVGRASKLVCGFESLGGTDCFFFATPTTMSDIISNTINIPDRLKQNGLVHYSPEYEFIKLVSERGWVPYQINSSKNNFWGIYRHINSKLRKQLIRVRVRKNCICVHLFQFCMRQIFQIHLFIFNFEIDFCVGTATSDISEK